MQTIFYGMSLSHKMSKIRTFLCIAGTISVCLILFIAPLKWGLIISHTDVTAPESIIEWLIISWQNRLGHLFVTITACIAAAALLFGERTLLTKIPLLIAVLAWAVFFFCMRNADAGLPTEWQAPGVTAQFALYGAWFFALVVLPVSRRNVLYACLALCASTLFVAHAAIEQHFGGLENVRVYVAENAGFASFADYTNAVLSHRQDYDTWLSIKKLSSPRVFGTFVYPNALGGFLIISILLSASVMISKTKLIMRILCGVTTAMASYALMLSRSKSTVVLAACGIVTLMFLATRARIIRRKTLFAVSVFVCACTVFFLVWGYGSRLTTKLHSTGNARIQYWQTAVEMIVKKPFAGWGTGGFSRYYSAYKPEDAEPARLAHNAFINVWTDYGLWATLALLVALGIPLIIAVAALRNRSTFNALHAGCTLAATLCIAHWCIDFDFHIMGIVLPALFCLAVGAQHDTDSFPLPA